MTGDQQDMQRRIVSLLPQAWFENGAPVLNSLIAGLAYTAAFIYSLIAYTALQTRILTATDGWLDLIAGDFFGSSLMRSANQSDASFRALILASLFRERATRNGMIGVLTALTGNVPTIIEPERPLDTGVYGAMCGYGAAGAYGSTLIPYQCFVTISRPHGTGIPNVAGYGVSTGAYRTPSQSEYADLSMSTSGISDADIYAAIDATKPAGTIIWTRLVG